MIEADRGILDVFNKIENANVKLMGCSDVADYLKRKKSKKKKDVIG